MFALNLIDKCYTHVVQCAAVTIHCSEMIEHPQLCSPKNCKEHWNGAAPSSASLPPTIRDDACGGYTSLILKVSLDSM